MSGKFDSRKDSHSTKLERGAQIFVKLSFRELCGSKLSNLHPFDYVAIIHSISLFIACNDYLQCSLYFFHCFFVICTLGFC